MSKKSKGSKSAKGSKSNGSASRKSPQGSGVINIPMSEWVVKHPFGGIIYESDLYYSKIANRVLRILIDEGFVPSYSIADVKYVALSLAAYFEDVISELCIFRAFITEYRLTYHKFFPWYKITEEYLEDEVNLVDVQFVMWLSLFSRREGSIPNPENLGILNASRKVYDLFVSEFEKAPVNEELVKDIYDEELNENAGKLKTLLMWIASQCYMCPQIFPTRRSLQRKLDDLHDLFSSTSESRLNEATKQYADESYKAFAVTCGPVALYPKNWYTLMCRQRKFYYYYNVPSIEFTPVYPFAIIADLKDSFVVCSCRGRRYTVSKKSFALPEVNNLKVGDIVIGMLFSFGRVWHICGLAFNYYIHDLKAAFKKLEEMAEELVDDMGRKIDFVGTVDTEIPNNSLYGMSYDPLKCAKAIANNGLSHLFYFQNFAEAEKWIQKNLIGKRTRKKTELPEGPVEEPVVLFITEDNHAFISSAAESIHDPANPYFESSSDEGLVNLLMDKSQLPDPMCKYMVEKGYFDRFGLDSIYGPEHGRELIQDNLRFFLTLCRQYQF